LGTGRDIQRPANASVTVKREVEAGTSEWKRDAHRGPCKGPLLLTCYQIW
jgi:hypothetical protein